MTIISRREGPTAAPTQRAGISGAGCPISWRSASVRSPSRARARSPALFRPAACGPQGFAVRGDACIRLHLRHAAIGSGETLHVFSTGRGTPYGLAAVPVIKMATRDELRDRWPDLIDISAGRIATGQATIEDIGWELFRLILEVASGRKRTWTEHWGLHNVLTLFNPGPVT